MSPSEWIAALSMLAALTSAVGGALAAHASGKSAHAAKKAISHTERVERRTLARAIVVAGQRLKMEADATCRLIELVQIHIAEQARRSSLASGGAHQQVIEGTADACRHVEAYLRLAASAPRDATDLSTISNDELSNQLAELNSALVAIEVWSKVATHYAELVRS